MAAAFLFYRSVWALVLIVPAVIACVCRGRTRREQEQIKRLQRQFQSAMQSVSGALGAGYSLEYAWRYAQGDCCRNVRRRWGKAPPRFLWGYAAERFCVILKAANGPLPQENNGKGVYDEFCNFL